MIDGSRRGYMIGCEIGRILAHVSDEELKPLAKWFYAWLQAAGYAHLGSEEDFVCGFVDGFRSTSTILNGASTC